MGRDRILQEKDGLREKFWSRTMVCRRRKRVTILKYIRKGRAVPWIYGVFFLIQRLTKGHDYDCVRADQFLSIPIAPISHQGQCHQILRAS